MTRFARIALAVGLCGIGAAALADKAAVDYDTTANFSSYRTYAWIETDTPRDELSHQRITRAIDGQLAAKGLARVEASASPNLFVSYHVLIGKDLQVTGWPSGYRFGGSGSARIRPQLTGSLAVYLADPKRKSIVWRGAVKRDLDTGASPEKRERNLAKATKKSFADFPPEA
jgi:hypothetical protein